jgi:hypothetical protein
VEFAELSLGINGWLIGARVGWFMGPLGKLNSSVAELVDNWFVSGAADPLRFGSKDGLLLFLSERSLPFLRWACMLFNG